MCIILDELQCGARGAATTGDNEAEQNQKAPAPMLVLMAGFAGVGKTTLAQRLNASLKWKMLNKDDLKLRRLANGEEVEQAGQNAFDELFELIEQEAIANGESVIIDTSNERPFIFENVTKVVEKMEECQIQARLKVILCVANKEIRTKRLYDRGSVFAPHVQELPTILDDSEWPERFKHLSVDESALSTCINDLLHLDDSKLPVHFNQLRHLDKLCVVDTTDSLETYADIVLGEVLSELNVFEEE